MRGEEKGKREKYLLVGVPVREGLPPDGCTTQRGRVPAVSLDLWVSSLYTFLPTLATNNYKY